MNSNFCSKEKIETNNIDPENEIYPCRQHNCVYFHKSENKEEKLMNSIFFLQEIRFLQIIEEFNEEEVFTIKTSKFDDSNDNLLNYILNNLNFTSSIKYVPTLLNMNFYQMKNPYLDYGRKGRASLLAIIETLCKNFPRMINEKMFERISYYNVECIFNILIKYYCDPNDENENSEKCYICFSPLKTQLIDCTCLCKFKIHLNCLLTLIKKGNFVCQTCKGSLRAEIDPRGRILFPYHNIYQSPLMGYYRTLNEEKELNECLHFAIAYLRCHRVEQILEKMTMKNI